MPLTRRFSGFLLCALFCAPPADAARIKVKTPAGPGAAGAAAGAVPAGAQLNAPQLLSPLSVPLQTPGLAPLEAGAAAGVELPRSDIVPAESAVIAAEAAPEFEALLELGETAQPGEREEKETARQDGGESGALRGRALFDGASAPAKAAPAVPTFGERVAAGWRGVRGFFYAPDKLPAKLAPGAKVRVAGRTYTLAWKLAESGGIVRYYSRSGGDVAVLILSERGAAGFQAELRALEAIAKTGIPHMTLRAVSADGRVIVQDYNDRGETAAEVLKAGRGRPLMKIGYFDLAAEFIAQGRTADLRPGNLEWDSWQTHWALQSAAGFARAPPVESLRTLMNPALLKAMDSSGLELLRAIRGRLDPDSLVWKRLQGAGSKDAVLKEVFAALRKYDAGRRRAPALSFKAAQSPASLNDALVSLRELRRRIGYDPFTVKTIVQLHGGDPGKLNTRVHLLKPEGKLPLVRKIAEPRIIKAELFMRKVVHRWFARHFAVPWSLAALNGYDSVMIMENAGDGRGAPRMTRETHAALGVLMTAFGVYDVNRGNILSGSDGRPVLIDFEQALGRRGPVSGRVPHKGILWELPWVNRRRGPMDVEDFFPGIRAWKKLFAEPETRAELRKMLAASGYEKNEVERVMGNLTRNTRNLSAALQSDVEFADGFLRRK